MAVTGIKRYLKLFQNIANPQEYLLHKGARRQRPLRFATRPHRLHFAVPESLYAVFKEIFLEDFYDIRALVKQLPERPVVLDVGANAGYFDLLLFSKRPEAVVYAYEPLPSNVERLQATIAANGWLKDKLHLFQRAVTGRPVSTLELFTEAAADNSVVASAFSDFDPRNTTSIQVEAQSLAEVLQANKLERVDLLKLDCEGSEYDILYHTDPSLLARIRHLVIEVHQLDQGSNNLEALSRFLEAQGYVLRSAPITAVSYYLEAVKK